jgi:hypothetical protein
MACMLGTLSLCGAGGARPHWPQPPLSRGLSFTLHEARLSILPGSAVWTAQPAGSAKVTHEVSAGHIHRVSVGHTESL